MRSRSFVLVALTLAAGGCLAPPQFAGGGLLGRPEVVSVDSGVFLVAGEEFLVRGVRWDPAPGEDILSVLSAVKRAGLNTVRVPIGAAALGDILDAAGALDLHVIPSHPGPSDASAMSPDEERAIEREVRTAVALRGSHPAVLLWEVGDRWDARTKGDGAPFLALVQRLADAIRREDPWHPISTVVGSIEAAERVRAGAPGVAVIGMPAYPKDPAAWRSAVWEPWSARIGDRPLLVVGYGGETNATAGSIEAAWHAIEAQRAAGPRIAAGAVLSERRVLEDAATLAALRRAATAGGAGTPPSILGLEEVPEGALVRVNARIVAHADRNLTVDLHFRGATGTWQTSPMREVAADWWSAAFENPGAGLVFYRVRAVDDAGRDRTSSDGVLRGAPAPGFLLAAAALALAAGRWRRGG